jgi:hypothetical protein
MWCIRRFPPQRGLLSEQRLSWNKYYLQNNNKNGSKIWGYDFVIVYKKGNQNVVAVALLGKDEDVEAFLCVNLII